MTNIHGMKRSFILVAEDDADDRFLLQTAFAENGYKDPIEFVENGVDLLKYLHSLALKCPDEIVYPRFILLDLNMPKKSGQEALAEIKQHASLRTIPVIVYTTTKNEADVRKCYLLGANTYIVKPTRFEALVKMVEALRSYWLNTATIPF